MNQLILDAAETVWEWIEIQSSNSSLQKQQPARRLLTEWMSPGLAGAAKPTRPSLQDYWRVAPSTELPVTVPVASSHAGRGHGILHVQPSSSVNLKST
jgi:hypothetical protein